MIVLSQELQLKLEEYLEKAIDSRFKFVPAEFGSGPVELHRCLVDVQETLTELEDYLSKSVRAKSLLERRVAKVRMEWQEAWDTAINKVNKRPSLGEYATGKEKASEANLATLNEARMLRQEENFLSFAAEAVEIIRLHYYGLDKVRQDIRKRLDMSQTDYYS
jgi:hypothetical protein